MLLFGGVVGAADTKGRRDGGGVMVVEEEGGVLGGTVDATSYQQNCVKFQISDFRSLLKD